MRMTVKRFLAVLLLTALLISGTGCACTYLLYRLGSDALTGTPAPAASPTAPRLELGSASQARPDVAFSDMRYERPDLDALEKELDALLADAKKGKKPVDELLGRYQSIQAAYNNADSQMSLSYLLYAMNVKTSEYKDEYADLYARLNELDLTMTDASIALLESEKYGAAARAAWGDEYSDTVFENETLNSIEIQPLLEREQDLTFQYDELLSSFELLDGGRRWTVEALAPAYYAGEIDYDEYVRLYDRYYLELNREAGKLFLDLLAVRDNIAKTLGFGSYAAYMYECYDRDYTVVDSRNLQEAVKRYIVPVYIRASTESYADLSDISFDLDIYFVKLQRAAKDFSPLLLESLNYMLRNDLYDFDVSTDKMEGSFTTYLSNYNAPFIFSQWEGSSGNVRTVIHELGHFTNYYLNALVGWSVSDPLDLAEVDSQGLELLFLRYYDTFFGKNAKTAAAETLLDAMYAIVTGCMEDEFQQEVYQNPSMTLDEMNELYLRLAGEYGMQELYGFTGTEWVGIPHTFQSPMYYISYATSMILSMELWDKSQVDYDAARNAYFAVLQREPYAKLRSTAALNGLSDPLGEGTIEHLADTLAGYFNLG